MSKDIVTVNEDCTVADVAELLERRRIKRVPVMRDGKVVGVVSRANLLRAIVTLAPGQPDQPAPFGGDDARLRAEIVLAMKGQRWAVAPENVIVKDGTVHLWGVIMSEEERQAARVAAENVPGVKKVVLHLEFPVVMPAA
jgi:CBS-domain-containing membrane protein